MNRKSPRTERKLLPTARPRAEWRVLPAVFMATLLAVPVNAAIIIPGDPLASGVRVAPNVLFILDDSGSMAWENINNGDISAITGSGSFNDGPDTAGVSSGNTGDYTDNVGNSEMYDQNYSTNTLYYNPSVTYEPWYNSTGVRLTGGTSYDDAYSNTNFVDYTGVENTTSSAQLNLTGATRTFYAPKAEGGNTTYLSNVGNYYRFQILAGTTTRIMRAAWGQVAVTASSPSISPTSGTTTSTTVAISTTGSVTENRAVEFTINNTSSGTGTRSLDYSVLDPSGAVACSGTAAEASSATCIATNTSAGTYSIRLQRSGDTGSNRTYSLTARTSTSCDGSSFTANAWSWVGCEEQTPVVPDAASGGTTQRTVAAEKTNFATWYSYYRTRIKTAKGGAAEAFNTQGNKVRVGYRSLHQNGSSNYNIPVQDGNDGRFVNNDGTNGNPSTTSRSVWFNRLFAASSGSGTPLQSVLDGAGQYFQGTGGSGPYGPETGTNQLSCRQNFTVLTTDGYWNGDAIATGTGGDGSNGSVITNSPVPAADPNYKTYQYTQALPYKDSNSNTLADVAMKYWKTDLRTDLTNNVPSEYSKIAAENNAVGKDPAFWQHMVTFTISIGLKAASGLSSVSEVTAATTWAAPGEDDVDNIDDLLHAAVNGRGTFVSASSPQAFADGLEAALAKISERTASFSNVGATSSTNLNTGTMIFSASYVSGRWTGLLRAENALTGAEVWKTTNSGSIPAYGSRNIYTRGGTLTGGVGAGGTGGGTTFPTAQQTAALVRTGGPANYEVTGADNALYIKGNQAKEGVSPGKLRPRTTLLGDIVDSSPTYVADTNTVFIGANDGMLHAFNAANGQELFAYIPGIINFGNLADLSRRDYDHRWFVDGPISISSRSISPAGDKNILVGSLGRGGKGVYALDVTTPAAFGTGNVKWERSSTGTGTSDNMGLVLGKSVLAKVRNGTSTSAVVLGNGINSGSDKAVLLVLNMDDGSVIREIPTDNTTNNGLFAPTGVYAADGRTLVYAYAGDLQGNVWKFDLTSSAPGSWSAKKIFHAEKTAGTPQPVTGGIASAVDPRSNKRWVFFGTGSFLTAADANDIAGGKQSVYGVIDDITTGSAYERSNLTSRSVTADGAGERYFQELTNLTTKGWYLDLPDNGERMVLDAQMDGSYLQFNTMMPSGNSCADASGSGYINAITPFADMSASTRSYFDLDGDGNTDDTGTSGKPTGSVKTSGIPTLSLLLPGEGRYGTADGVGKYSKGRPQWNRVSWREMRED
ncbi:MAG TPA: PilC/PilY family type IV pilus protein [Thermomonas sp.]|nr:PilC/PilY family type IV pilus protein [Thermomonas sp.]